MSAPTQKIIIDTDPGVDDAMALLLAAASPELEIVGVTALFGNGPHVSHMARNAGALLQLAGRPEIPVAVGANRPLMRPYAGDATVVHGENGLGDVALPAPVQPPVDTPAPLWIVEQARAAPGDITLVTLASLTNIALALQLEPRLPEWIPRIVMMGGAVHTPGNVTPVAEANIYNDPEAAHVVFNAGWEIVMAGLDVTCDFTVDRTFLDRLHGLGNGAGRFLGAAGQHYLDFYLSTGRDGFCMHDVHPLVYLLRPDLFVARRACVDVVTTPGIAFGQTIADWRGQWGRPAQTQVLLSVDKDAFIELFVARMATLP